MRTKPISFSRYFPAYHPLKGQPTYFVEAILTQLGIDYTSHEYLLSLIKLNPKISEVFLNKFISSLSENIYPKSHTIRDHKMPVSPGDFIIPNVWAGRPYNKTEEGFWQIKFAPNIEVKKTFDIKINLRSDPQYILINDREIFFDEYSALSKNDGLTTTTMTSWFSKPAPLKRSQVFVGKIICWNQNINY